MQLLTGLYASGQQQIHTSDVLLSHAQDLGANCMHFPCIPCIPAHVPKQSYFGPPN